ncbi:MAG: PEP-CTERM sorting domain-containing protein [Alphaproteobacteria bacterium]|nr:PEP-CTERM sorting domain-containing protein [Alphaproteobacteria bacterium]MBN9571265.1 PEP-CTERM sorting domain-containing protein [Alphaproteobacteria bacterium]
MTPPVTTGVPEPATWLMMIFGLFAVMAMGCRRVNAQPGSHIKSA